MARAVVDLLRAGNSAEAAELMKRVGVDLEDPGTVEQPWNMGRLVDDVVSLF